MGEIKFTIPGKPGHKARHRTTKSGFTYTPKETVQYENLVKHLFQEAAPEFVPIHGPVQLEVRSLFPIPKSTPKKKLALMRAEDYPYIKKPDRDNVGKAIQDALNEIAWRDDAVIYDGRDLKFYSERPRVEITIRWLEGEW